MSTNPNRFKKTGANGYDTEEGTVDVASTPATTNAGRVVSLNSAGFVDPTLANAGSAGGASDANKLAQLDTNGRLTVAMMPVGFAADIDTIIAGEALSAGNLVSIQSGGAFKADASAGKPAHGFVLASYASGATATVYFEGTCGGLSGLTLGPVFLSPTTPGAVTNTPPVSGSGKLQQAVGLAVSTTAINFQFEPATQLL